MEPYVLLVILCCGSSLSLSLLNNLGFFFHCSSLSSALKFEWHCCVGPNAYLSKLLTYRYSFHFPLKCTFSNNKIQKNFRSLYRLTPACPSPRTKKSASRKHNLSYVSVVDALTACSTRNTLDCDQSNVYSSRAVFWAISRVFSFFLFIS